MNYIRVHKGIPIIDDQLSAMDAPTNKFQGIRWRNSNHPTITKKLIHNTKTVDATQENGWNESGTALGITLMTRHVFN